MKTISNRVHVPFSSYGGVLVVTLWFGLVAGLLEGVAKAVLLAIPGYTIRVSSEILWIAPVFNTLLFLLLAAGLSILFRLRRQVPSTAIMAGLFTWVILFGALLFIDKLHNIAAFLLSFGVALELGRRLQNHPQSLLQLQRRTLPWLFAITLLLGVAGAMWPGLRERNLVSQLPQPPANAPNLILITVDTLRADHVSAYGYDRATTPNIDRMAQQGVLFENAFANSSWTLPAHASMFTGRLPHEHNADWQSPLDGRYPILAEELARQGYLTAAFSANAQYVTPTYGLGRGFAHFEVFGSSLADDFIRTVYGNKLALVILPRLGYYDIPGRKRASELNQELLRWLDDENERPFFTFLNYFDVHDPYVTVAPYQTKYAAEVTRGELINFQFQISFRRKPKLSPQEIQMEIDSYDGALSYLDAQLGLLFSELADRGLLENTLVIVNSDHGESFGEHDLFGHGNSLYLETIRVPLIVAWPGKIPSALKIAEPVSLHQIPTTVMELLNGVDPVPFPGESLVNYWSADAENANMPPIIAELSPGRFRSFPAYPTAKGQLQSLLTEEWHFIDSESDQGELYDWQRDPTESRDRSAEASLQSEVEALQEQLRSLIRPEIDEE